MRVALQHLNDVVLQLNVAGSLAAGASKALQAVPFAGHISHVKAKTRTTGTKPGDATTNVVLDLNKNGTSLVGGTFATFAGASTDPAYAAGVTGRLAVAEGDILTLDVDTVFDGTGPVQPADLVVTVVIKRFPDRAVVTGDIDHKSI